ncbi:beta strand repeat-containing protein [Lactococcus termiticola]|nr:hypothetical protein [Lactococcus termiticola]
MNIGAFGSTGGLTGNLSLDLSSLTFSGQKGTEPVIVNYLNNSSKAVIAPSTTITANISDIIGTAAAATTPSTVNATGNSYNFVPPALAGYTTTSYGTAVTVQSYDPTVSNNPNVINVAYTPLTNNVLTFSNASGNAASFPTVTYNNLTTGTAIPSSVTTDLTGKIPAGYYISAIKQGTTTIASGGTTSATLNGLTVAGLTVGADTSGTGANAYTVVLSAQPTATGTYTYATGALNTPAAPSFGSYQGDVGTALPTTTINTTMNGKVPAGYYISSIAGTNMTTVTGTQTNPAQFPTGTAAPTFAASGNSYTVTLAPITQSVTFNYQFSSSTGGLPGEKDTPGANGVAGKLVTGAVSGNTSWTGTLPNSTTVSGAVGSVVPTQTPVLPAIFLTSGGTAGWKNPLPNGNLTSISSFNAPYTIWINTNDGYIWAQTGTYTYTAYTAATGAVVSGKTMGGTANGQTAMSIFQTSTSANAIYKNFLAAAGNYTFIVVPNQATLKWTISDANNPNDPVNGTSGNTQNVSAGSLPDVTQQAITAAGYASAADMAAAGIKITGYTWQGKTFNVADYGYSLSATYAAMLATAGGLSAPNQTVTINVASDNTAISSNATNTIPKTARYTPVTDITSALDADGGDDNGDGGESVNGAPVGVVIIGSDSSNSSYLYMGNATDNVQASSNPMENGNYAETFYALTLQGVTDYNNWLASNPNATVGDFIQSGAAQASDYVMSTTALIVTDFSLPFTGGAGLAGLVALAGIVTAGSVAIRKRKKQEENINEEER